MCEIYYPQRECECGAKKRIDEEFCKDCRKEIEERFKKVMKDNFTPEEVEYLNEKLDGESITYFVFKKED